MEIYTLACSIYESKVDDVYIFRCTTNPHSKQAREVFPLSFLSLVGPTPHALSIGAFPNPSPWHPTRVEAESDPIKTLARGPRESPRATKDGFESDTDEIGSGCHLLPYFNPDTNTNADLIRYEYKTDSSNLDSNPDTFSTWNIDLSRVSVYFINNFIVDQNHYTSRE